MLKRERESVINKSAHQSIGNLKREKKMKIHAHLKRHIKTQHLLFVVWNAQDAVLGRFRRPDFMERRCRFVVVVVIIISAHFWGKKMTNYRYKLGAYARIKMPSKKASSSSSSSSKEEDDDRPPPASSSPAAASHQKEDVPSVVSVSDLLLKNNHRRISSSNTSSSSSHHYHHHPTTMLPYSEPIEVSHFSKTKSGDTFFDARNLKRVREVRMPFDLNEGFANFRDRDRLNEYPAPLMPLFESLERSGKASLLLGAFCFLFVLCFILVVFVVWCVFASFAFSLAGKAPRRFSSLRIFAHRVQFFLLLLLLSPHY